MGRIINIFVSHAGEDENKIEPVKQLMRNKGFIIRDDSITESEPNNASNPDYIKYQILADRINRAGCMVVLIGDKTASKDWVNWEIDYAMKKEKRIVGVFLKGAKDNDIPDALLKYGDALVGWNSNKIADAINGEDIWLDSSGKARAENNMFHGTC